MLFCFLFAAHIQQQAEDQQAHADTDADIRKIEHREIDEQAVQVIHHHAGADTVDQVANSAAHDQNPSSTLQTRHFAQKQHTGQHSQHHTGNDHQQRALAAIAPGAQTPPLFDCVTYANVVEGDLPQGTAVDIICRLTAIQSDYVADANTPQDVWAAVMGKEVAES